MTESDLVAHLKADTTLNTLVNGRIYPLIAPQNVARPYITYQVVAGRRLQCLKGNIYQGDFRFQIDVWGLTYSSVKAISEAVKNCLVGFLDSNNINIMDGHESETQLFRQIIDFKIKNKD